MTDSPWYNSVVLPALLRHARYTYGRAMRAALEEAGFGDIPANGLYVIGGLALNREETGLGDLIRDLRISKQAAGQLVDQLVLRGYLDRQVDGNDRRRLTISLTERGRAAAATQGAARDRIDAELHARVGDEAIGQARRVLGTLCEMGREVAED